jgi:hypothetical protein
MWDSIPCNWRKLIIGIAFVYAAYTIVTCPCTFIGSCHIAQLGVSLLIGMALLVYENRSIVF